MLEMFDRLLDDMPKWAASALALVLIALIAYLDYLTGAELSFSIFYMPPIMLAAWYSGRKGGAAMSLAGALCWLAADLATGHKYLHQFIPLWNMTVRFAFFLMAAMLLGQLKAQLLHLRKLAETDQLTGLTNSRRFYELMDYEKNRSMRYAHPFTLAYIDLDNFKAVNDSLGHDEGDRLLVTFANALRASIRASDSVARLGGDEFGALFPETGFDPAGTLLDNLRGRLIDTMGREDWPVTVSMGAVTFEDAGEDVQSMLKAADDLMYRVKKSGKNAVLHELRPQTPKPGRAETDAGPEAVKGVTA